MEIVNSVGLVCQEYANLLVGVDGEIQIMQHIREVRLMTRDETKMSTGERSDNLRHI